MREYPHKLRREGGRDDEDDEIGREEGGMMKMM